MRWVILVLAFLCLTCDRVEYRAVYIDKGFDNAERSMILEALDDWNRSGCGVIVFDPNHVMKTYHPTYIYPLSTACVGADNAVGSATGNNGSYFICIQTPAPRFSNTIRHELGHSLGYHFGLSRHYFGSKPAVMHPTYDEPLASDHVTPVDVEEFCQ